MPRCVTIAGRRLRLTQQSPSVFFRRSELRFPLSGHYLLYLRTGMAGVYMCVRVRCECVCENMSVCEDASACACHCVYERVSVKRV